MATVRQKLLKKNFKIWETIKYGRMMSFFLDKKQLNLNRYSK